MSCQQEVSSPQCTTMSQAMGPIPGNRLQSTGPSVIASPPPRPAAEGRPPSPPLRRHVALVDVQGLATMGHKAAMITGQRPKVRRLGCGRAVPSARHNKCNCCVIRGHRLGQLQGSPLGCLAGVIGWATGQCWLLARQLGRRAGLSPGAGPAASPFWPMCPLEGQPSGHGLPSGSQYNNK